PYAARHAFAAARLLFRWAYDRELIAANPCDRIKGADLHGAPAKRSRILSDDELRAVWRATEVFGYPYGPLVRLLLLTGGRLRELAEASWKEIDRDAAILAVPPTRMKMRAAHVIPLTPAALAIAEASPYFAEGSYLFTTTSGRRPISGFSKFRASFNNILKMVGWTAAEPFTIHDLRRTARTRLSQLGVLPVVAELVIGHQQQGISAIYDRHTYDKEKRAALQLWADELLRIVGETPPEASVTVVPLRARVH